MDNTGGTFDLFTVVISAILTPNHYIPAGYRQSSSVIAVSAAAHQNSQNPTCRAPVEILSAIFSLLVSRITIEEEDWPTLFSPRYRPSYSFSQVCRHWRQVALSTPSLWTDIHLEDNLFALEMVERSQSVPLNLSVKLYTRYADKDLRRTKRKLENAFVQNFHRIASLKLHIADPTDIPVLESTSRPHSIHLECGCSRTNPLTILDSLIGEPHRLRNLAIMAVLSHYNFTGLISNLTYLHLTMFSFEGPPRPSLAETLAIVDEAHNLETLHLERIRSYGLDDFTGAICDVPPSAPHSKRSTLKRLRLLRLAGGLDCAHFLGYLSFPSSTSVDLDRKWEPVPPAIRQSTKSALSQLFPSSLIRSLMLDQYLGDESIRDLAYCHELSLAEFRSPSIYHRRERNPPRLRISFSNDREDCSAHMKSMYECLPLSRLSTLHLRHVETWVPNLKGHIKDAFGALSELHTVSIWGPEIAYDVIPIFGQTAGHDQQVAGSTVLYFPALRRLWLDMWEENWSPGKESDGTSHDLLKQLIGVLSTRKRCGCGIENLVLMNHEEEEVSVQGVDRMREVVENVEVYPDRGPLNSGSETE